MALALVCLLGAQIAGLTHRVAHGDRLVQLTQSADSATPWAHDDHNCQLFDALTLASFAGTAATRVSAPPCPASFLVLPELTRNASRELLGFQSRAPPADPRPVV
jgi:hypothetical protein